jgi:hypothetical protein
LLFYLQIVIYFSIETVPCLEIKKLGGSPVTEGGEDLDLNFIATIGYPEPLKTKDIQKIIDNAPFVEKMLAAGNKKSYMAQMGYLERQGFNDCFTGYRTFCVLLCIQDECKHYLKQQCSFATRPTVFC